ncbi:DoxX family protein [Mesorhizobium sp. BR1-1-16]|uniref:DoxX family protein n=1 Tax=Mesorhizobium sp. BR1-1-16 TaxID=2876653 RepID=UPI001CCFB299|nr:DoxX family protein [Mesorhizobium sp. BR1-1-16]MBZ9936724.1 DoxX family protein [Mesorhizobium sp. BR1-1-16]
MAAMSAPSRVMTIVIWVLCVLLAALFLMAAFMKLSGQPTMVEEFGVIGLGQWFRYLTGLLELIGSIALLVPAVSVLGAVLLLCIDIGAFITQAFVLHGDVVHTIVIAALLLVVIYLQRERLKAFLP